MGGDRAAYPRRWQHGRSYGSIHRLLTEAGATPRGRGGDNRNGPARNRSSPAAGPDGAVLLRESDTPPKSPDLRPDRPRRTAPVRQGKGTVGPNRIPGSTTKRVPRES
ncbi:helix-turn-helix domain-containing protein [Streptomyces spiramyceticus]|uniref:helix-turn-helix domain-containing protein n=1 Tax=Streptomyces spiramyceticus TaxID=299717 RepID=UPI00237A2536|nr:helix-turn-helix domain-containing protein [Streptomyces spiramyceticus]